MCTRVGDLGDLAADSDKVVLDYDLRRDVITCGELAQACYDSCEKEAYSVRRCWTIYAGKPEKISDVSSFEIMAYPQASLLTACAAHHQANHIQLHCSSR